MSRPRILVVDDEPAVLGLVANALSAWGYEVHAAPGPRQALEFARREPCFDVLVSDVIMPEMCGPALVREISQVCPGAAVVMMSGYIAAEVLPRGAAFISKPFRLSDLRSAVAGVLATSVESMNRAG